MDNETVMQMIHSAHAEDMLALEVDSIKSNLEHKRKLALADAQGKLDDDELDGKKEVMEEVLKANNEIFDLIQNANAEQMKHITKVLSLKEEVHTSRTVSNKSGWCGKYENSTEETKTTKRPNDQCISMARDLAISVLKSTEGKSPGAATCIASINLDN